MRAAEGGTAGLLIRPFRGGKALTALSRVPAVGVGGICKP